MNSTGEKKVAPLVSQWETQMEQMMEWTQDSWTAAHLAESWAWLRVSRMAVMTGCLRVLATGKWKAGRMANSKAKNSVVKMGDNWVGRLGKPKGYWWAAQSDNDLAMKLAERWVDQWQQNLEMKKVYDLALLLVARMVRWRVLYCAKQQGKETA